LQVCFSDLVEAQSTHDVAVDDVAIHDMTIHDITIDDACEDIMPAQIYED
jgi:hypothetical protein